ncbi:hypothetical protein [Denitrobaculum tricleocarpae]|uniref:Uncharacterized protein n=1 Tax=Denitrobaculum tricleocarpae TaxID=2591009 RepID=A0A545TKV3_9PROT|nr:hypothetical protein [Denitrobaculum tricleocarpae]TQV77828.1 hypothetical protein FKG95_19945 [Denitrobaculum tricleocarpae]
MILGRLRDLFLFGSCLLVVVFGASTAEALSCRKPGVQEHIRNSDLVFYGSLQGRPRVDRDKREWMGKFKVLWAYKGVEDKSVIVTLTNTRIGDLSGRRFSGGMPILVFAEREGVNEDGLVIASVHYCSMMAYHGRSHLHPKYWYLLNQLQ